MICLGLRGICYFFIEVQCCAKDLHSGVFGGTVHEGMADLIYMMNTLLDKGTLTYDVRKILLFFEPPPPLQCSNLPSLH